MRWRGLLGLSLVACLAPAGCQTAKPDPAFRPELPAPLGVAALARGQKPPRPHDNLLNLGPDDPGGGREHRAARIRAVVNGEPILDEEVESAAYQNLVNARTPAERAEVLNQKLTEIIEREVVLQDAFAKLKGNGEKFLNVLKDAARKEFDKQWLRRMMKGNGFTDEQAFRRFLREHNMPLEAVRREWERQFMMMEYMRHRIDPHLQKIGHLQIVEYYDKHPDQFTVQDSVQWQDLFVANARHPSREAARAFAEALAGRIRKGEDFVRLAKEFDNGDSLFRNGEGIGHKRGEIKPGEAEAVLFRLRDGEVGPLVELETGFHVVRLVKRQHAGVLPFDSKVQTQIRDKLKGEVFQREMKRIVRELKRKAVIEIASEIR
jgi:parvulin-like peptidyl-prolyl isomerase